MPSFMTELPIMTSRSGVIVVLSLGPPQVPGGGRLEERPLNSRAMRTRSADLVSARVQDGDAVARDAVLHEDLAEPLVHAVGSQKMTWPQCGLAATRRAHSTNFGARVQAGRGRACTLTDRCDLNRPLLVADLILGDGAPRCRR
jgi:hypothetical protein